MLTVICGNKLFFDVQCQLVSLWHTYSAHIHSMDASSLRHAWKAIISYSNTIVYNNFPWPETIKPEQQAKIEAAAQLVLDARTFEENRCAEQGQKCSLASMYAPGNMPTGLLKAHNQLDNAVDAAYGYKPVLSKVERDSKDDSSRVAFLFEQYQKRVAPPQAESTNEAETPPTKPTTKRSALAK